MTMEQGEPAAILAPAGADAAPPRHRRDTPYAWYVAGVLALCQMASFIDRQLINLLVTPIKADFQLTDTSVSVLIGIAFTIVHVTLAIPLGRLVDRGHQRSLILICGLLWSLSSMVGGLAHSYTGLFLSRVGVGAAEAGIYPAAAALVALYFSRRALARAMSIMLLGPFIGGGVSLIFGGVVIGKFQQIGNVVLPLVGVMKPWQMTLVIVSAIGLLPILLILTVREPPLRAVPEGFSATPTFREALAYLRHRASFYGYYYPGMALHTMAIYAVPAWAPALLIRRYGLSIASVGVRYGIVSLIAGVLGMLAGPSFAAWLDRRGVRHAKLHGMWTTVLLSAALVALLPFMPTPNAALALLFAMTFAYTMPMALASAALQEVTPDRLRGFAGAVNFVALSLVGLAIAPTLVGLATDHLFGDPVKVGWSLALVVASAGAISVLLLRQALHGYRTWLPDEIVDYAGGTR
jgi:MFS family permease